MQPELFDMRARAQRRDRALRSGPVLFVHERAFDDVLERISEIRRTFTSALLIGAPDRGWPGRLASAGARVTVLDPGIGFARAADGNQVVEDRLELDPGSFDLCVAIGTLDTVNDLPGALLRLRILLKPDALLIGAMSGGETLPRLRQAMRAADAVTGAAAPHIHPRVGPAALADLLASAGFLMPVVDVDRVRATYDSLHKLVADLRGMGATNVLSARPRTPVSRAALLAAQQDFLRDADDGRSTETFEILHFAAWTPADPAEGNG